MADLERGADSRRQLEEAIAAAQQLLTLDPLREGAYQHPFFYEFRQGLPDLLRQLSLGLSMAYDWLVLILLGRLAGLPLLPRVVTAVLLIWPMAFVLGMPFPLG